MADAPTPTTECFDLVEPRYSSSTSAKLTTAGGNEVYVLYDLKTNKVWGASTTFSPMAAYVFGKPNAEQAALLLALTGSRRRRHDDSTERKRDGAVNAPSPPSRAT